MAPGPILTPRTRANFARDVLDQLGVPESDSNINALLAQWQVEEPNYAGAENNPGNIEVATAQSLGYSNVGSWNLAPQIALFPSWSEGVTATAKELASIAPNAVSDMRNSASSDRIVEDIGSSGWGTGTAGMLERLHAHDLAPTQVVAGTGSATPSQGGGIGQGTIQHGIGNPLSGVASSITGAFGSAESFALRAGKVLLGIAMLLAAVFLAMGKSMPVVVPV